MRCPLPRWGCIAAAGPATTPEFAAVFAIAVTLQPPGLCLTTVDTENTEVHNSSLVRRNTESRAKLRAAREMEVSTVVVATTIVGCMGKGIREEIKQTKPFRSVEAEAFLSLVPTSEQLQT